MFYLSPFGVGFSRSRTANTAKSAVASVRTELLWSMASTSAFTDEKRDGDACPQLYAFVVFHISVGAKKMTTKNTLIQSVGFNEFSLSSRIIKIPARACLLDGCLKTYKPD